MGDSHPYCTPDHVCDDPSGEVCIEPGCENPAGTFWGPLWCPVHDKERLDRISDALESLSAPESGA